MTDPIDPIDPIDAGAPGDPDRADRSYAILRLAGPFAAFGGPSGDQMRRTGRFPLRSMIVGLIGNALGLDRTRPEDMLALHGLQERLRLARLAVAPGRLWTDYQVARPGSRQVDDPELVAPPFQPRGSYAKDVHDFLAKGLVVRKQYLTDLRFLVALAVAPPSPASPPAAAGGIALEAIVAALRRPARALFLGRKACPLSAPVIPAVHPLVTAPDGCSALRDYLQRTDNDAEDRPVPASPAAAPAADGTVLVEVQWDPGEAPATPDGAPLADWLEKGFVETVEDRRDWLAGHHIGASTVWLGRMRVPARPRAGTDPTAPAGRTNRETRHVAR